MTKLKVRVTKDCEDILQSDDTNNRCPDFDEDCNLVKDHLSCYIGINCKDGVAKGYCPFLNQQN